MHESEEQNNKISQTRALRYFPIAGLLIFILASLVLGYSIRKTAEETLIQAEEGKNIALAQVISNTIWKKYQDFLSRASALHGDEIRRHRKTAEITRELKSIARDVPVVKVMIFDMNGKTVFSTNQKEIGKSKSMRMPFQLAAGGQTVSKISMRDQEYLSKEGVGTRNIMSSYIPIVTTDGKQKKIAGVLELYTDVTALMGEVQSSERKIMIEIFLVLAFAYLLFMLTVRRVNRILGEKEKENQTNRAQIEHAAYHDTLTGLPNRNMFLDRLEQSLPRARRNEKLVGVMFVDLDRFKHVNDSLGHAAGDELLKEVAHRLKDCMRAYDTIARQGGDEFTVLLEEIAHVDEVVAIAERVLSSLHKPFVIQGHDVVMGCSIGITIYPFDDVTIEHLLQNADAAMYKAKQQGRNQYVFFSADMDDGKKGRMDLERNLRKALNENEYLYHLQPQVDAHTGSLVGAEVLLRWQHKDFGMVSPAEFVPVLEDCGLICTVGKWVLQHSCETYVRWIKEGYPPFKLSVNVSPIQFRNINFAETLREVLDTTGMDPKWLTLELTESMLIDNLDASTAKLKQLKEMGVSIALDDFGTGYSSLSYLQKFPIDTLKIDRSFVTDVARSSDKAAIVTAIAALAHSLKLGVVAEGVEEASELTYLSALGCNVIQGYFFSKPLAVDDFEQVLRNTTMFQEKMAAIRR